ncbi:MAG: hypothetical protein Ct9H90mP27_5280 [Gammaproteobacteria bacterium]|nr:MAG: hypothetical protein Ct9H90mP27_5280 [Gammaproteobacteria bacterium]
MNSDGAIFLNIGLDKKEKGVPELRFFLSEQAARSFVSEVICLLVRADQKLQYGRWSRS